jgi:hypothetical protein
MRQTQVGLTLFAVFVCFRKSAITAKVGSETDKKLSEALSNENWGASSTLLNELAQLSYD